jgi:putative ABC transport system permease protein
MTLILPEQEEPKVPLLEAPQVRPKQGFWQSFTQRTPIGWKQLTKKKGRLFVAIAGIGFADLLMFAQMGIQAALFDGNVLLNRSMDADIVIRSAQYRDLSLANTLPRRRIYQVQDIPNVASADALYISTVVWRNPETRLKTQLTLVGQSVERPALNFPEVNKNLDKLKQPDTFLFDRKARGKYENVVAAVENGKMVTTEIERRSIKVAGLFSLGASFATDGTLITSQENFLRFFPDRTAGQITLGLVKVKDGSDVKQVLADIKAVLPKDTIASTKQEYIDHELAYWGETTVVLKRKGRTRR